jgi:extensin-like protein
MARGVARYLVGSFVVLGLAACGRSWLAERDAWRHEAELACLKSGQVKEGPAMVRIAPITGPGICGADFPLRVSAFGEPSAVGYTDELRPPGAVGRFPLAEPPEARPIAGEPYRPRGYPVAPAYPQPPYSQPAANGPMSIRPPGVDQPDLDDEGEYQLGAPDQPMPPSYPRRAPPAGATVVPPETEQVPLGPQRALPATPAIAVQPAATLACPVISALDTWFAADVQPAALHWFGQPVAEIRQFSAYSCRSVNNQPGNGLSEHAFGNALDIAAFTLADGRKVNVEHGWRGAPEEQGFLRDVHAAACKHFSTVLGPGADVFHYNHFHVDMARRRNGYTVCRPNPVRGDQVAGRLSYPRRGEVTGSIGHKPTRMPAQRVWRGRDAEVYDGLPAAVPGED